MRCLLAGWLSVFLILCYVLLWFMSDAKLFWCDQQLPKHKNMETAVNAEARQSLTRWNNLFKLTWFDSTRRRTLGNVPITIAAPFISCTWWEKRKKFDQAKCDWKIDKNKSNLFKTFNSWEKRKLWKSPHTGKPLITTVIKSSGCE